MLVHIYKNTDSHFYSAGWFSKHFHIFISFRPQLPIGKKSSSSLLVYKELWLRQAKRFAQNGPKVEEQNSKVGFLFQNLF